MYTVCGRTDKRTSSRVSFESRYEPEIPTTKQVPLGATLKIASAGSPHKLRAKSNMVGRRICEELSNLPPPLNVFILYNIIPLNGLQLGQRIIICPKNQLAKVCILVSLKKTFTKTRSKNLKFSNTINYIVILKPKA